MEPILFDEVDQSQYQDSLKTIATYQLNVLNPKKLRNHITPSDGVSPLSLLFRTPDR